MAGSAYGRAWTAGAALLAAGWAADALVESPTHPLVLLLLVLGCYAGLLVSRTSWWAPDVALRRFGNGLLSTAAGLLVLVGIGHHVVAGLATATAVAATSPALRCRTGGRARRLPGAQPQHLGRDPRRWRRT